MTEKALTNKVIVILVAPRFDEDEATAPYRYLTECGAVVHYAGIERGTCEGKRQTRLDVQATVNELNPGEIDALVIPGGGAPERLRLDPGVLGLVRELVRQGKPVAAICHGPQVLISAGVVRGRAVTSHPGIRDDLVNAGAIVHDRAVVVDANLITSRNPGDLPAFNQAIADALSLAERATASWVNATAPEAIEIAIYKEVQAQRRYSELATRCKDKLARAKFKFLAETERDHREQLVEIYRKLSGGKKPQARETGIDKESATFHPEDDLMKILSMAIVEELASHRLYRFMAERARSAEAREIFQRLADEEMAHKALLEQELATRSQAAPPSAIEEQPWWSKDLW